MIIHFKVVAEFALLGKLACLELKRLSSYKKKGRGNIA